MTDDALSKDARWKATVVYRSEAGPVDVEFLLEELCDLHDRVEAGPHWDTIESIVVRRANVLTHEHYTLEESERE